jgi:predicted anti-sigma-YlaC factor YlaD
MTHDELVQLAREMYRMLGEIRHRRLMSVEPSQVTPPVIAEVIAAGKEIDQLLLRWERARTVQRPPEMGCDNGDT